MLTVALVIAILLVAAILVVMTRTANMEAELIKMRGKRRPVSNYQGELSQALGEVEHGMIGGVDASDITGPDIFR